ATIHYMTEKLDQGDLVAQVETQILPEDTSSSLYKKLNNLVPELVSQFATFLASPDRRAIPQDGAKATYFRNARRIHRRIFWSTMTSTQIVNLVRACDGSAYCWLGGQKVFIHRAESVPANRNMTNQLAVPPGTVVDRHDDASATVAVQDGFVCLKKSTGSAFGNVAMEIGQIFT
ncbi:MAG TPA: formyltransferase family protein, partial [Nitrospiria bacterium]|nr:formyltransferase family protein [Nitrospiria bacterium]